MLKEGPTAYIANTNLHDGPGRQWIALWTEGNVCQVMDSYGVSLDVYGTADHQRMDKKTFQVPTSH